MAKASLFEFKKLLRSNQSQVLAVLRKIADEERKIPRTTLQPNSLYIMRDFGLPMTDAEKEEFTKDITPTMDIWRPLFIPPLCQEVESH